MACEDGEILWGIDDVFRGRGQIYLRFSGAGTGLNGVLALNDSQAVFRTVVTFGRHAGAGSPRRHPRRSRADRSGRKEFEGNWVTATATYAGNLGGPVAHPEG
jgi:hypothetical protein